MYVNGQQISDDMHFIDHIECQVPVQIYLESNHRDIGFIEQFNNYFIQVNNTFYNRSMYTFISRPGY